MIKELKHKLRHFIRPEYDRMNPDDRLFDRLEEYSLITYGTEPYALSTAEAAYLIKRNKRTGV